MAQLSRSVIVLPNRGFAKPYVGFLSRSAVRALYKALLFLQVQSGIKSGTLNLEHSYKYRPLDAYLIDRECWQRDRTLLIERAALQAFVDPNRVLAELDEARDAGTGDQGLTSLEREELTRLKHEVRQLRQEREILSKAAAWFAQESIVIPKRSSDS